MMPFDPSDPFGSLDTSAVQGPPTGVGGTGTAVEEVPTVFMGRRPGERVVMANEAAGSVRRVPTRGKVDDILTLPEVQDIWFGWDDDERQKWADHLVDAGVIDDESRYDYAELQKWWFTASEEAASFQRTGRDVTPWEAANLIGGGDESGATAGSLGRGAAGEEGPVRRYSTSSRARSVDLTDPTTAKAMVNSVLAKALGRNATDEELDAFRDVLNRSERAHPRISDSTTQYVLNAEETGYNTTTSTTTRGGVDPGQVLQDEAEEHEEYGATQAALTYFNVLEQALGTVGGNE